MAKELKSCRIIFVMGGPGTGKTTSCKKLEELGFKTITMAKVLEKEDGISRDSKARTKDYSDASASVPMNVIIQSLRDCLIRESAATKKFAIVGFPKDIDQATNFEKEIGSIDVAIYLKASDEVMLMRTEKGAQEQGKEVDIDSINNDDDASVIMIITEQVMRRIEWFKAHQAKVLDFYAKKRKVCEIDCASNEEVVWQKVLKCLSKRIT